MRCDCDCCNCDQLRRVLAPALERAQQTKGEKRCAKPCSSFVRSDPALQNDMSFVAFRRQQ
jgi:hypothetical protein